MFVIANKYGPDHIIFPQVKGNPMMDKLFWNIYGDKLEFSDEPFLYTFERPFFKCGVHPALSPAAGATPVA